MEWQPEQYFPYIFVNLTKSYGDIFFCVEILIKKAVEHFPWEVYILRESKQFTFSQDILHSVLP